MVAKSNAWVRLGCLATGCGLVLMVQRVATAQPENPPPVGKIVFSKSPIDPNKPSNLTNGFKAGDYIYGLIQMDKTWREVYNAKGKSELAIMINMEVGEEKDYQYITMHKASYIDAKTLVLDIAPEPSKMTAYKDADLDFGKGKGNRKIGPIAFTYDLAQLKPGKHKVLFKVTDYGTVFAAGEMEIDGQDFKFYADLHEKVKQAETQVARFPEAKKTDKELEANMRKLLENAGWNKILRLAIVDKDWWIDYVDGSDSPVKSRHIAAAAAAKDKDGGCYYCIVTFHQPKLADGSWGKLELTDTGEKNKIPDLPGPSGS